MCFVSLLLLVQPAHHQPRSQPSQSCQGAGYRKGSGTNEDITKTKQTLRLQFTCILKIVTCLPDPFLSACRALPKHDAAGLRVDSLIQPRRRNRPSAHQQAEENLLDQHRDKSHSSLLHSMHTISPGAHACHRQQLLVRRSPLLTVPLATEVQVLGGAGQHQLASPSLKLRWPGDWPGNFAFAWVLRLSSAALTYPLTHLAHQPSQSHQASNPDHAQHCKLHRTQPMQSHGDGPHL